MATAAGLVGLFVIVMLAAAVQGIPQITPPDIARPDGEYFEEPTATPAPSDVPLPEPESDLIANTIRIVFLVVVIAAAVLVAILIVRVLMRAWRERPLRTRAGGDIDVESAAEHPSSEADAVAPVMRRGIDGALASIAQGATPTDGIVAAWVGLEENAADAGFRRGPSETPAEFALRIITRRTGLTDAATALLGLYERVRFGGYVADEQDRAAARSALETIREGWR